MVSYEEVYVNPVYSYHSGSGVAYGRCTASESYTALPETEVYPMHIPLGISQGCPVISDNVMREVDVLLKTEKKLVLLWTYD